jgi:hypothetical protein
MVQVNEMKVSGGKLPGILLREHIVNTRWRQEPEEAVPLPAVGWTPEGARRLGCTCFGTSALVSGAAVTAVRGKVRTRETAPTLLRSQGNNR